jgi:hypothetical protein
VRAKKGRARHPVRDAAAQVVLALFIFFVLVIVGVKPEIALFSVPVTFLLSRELDFRFKLQVVSDRRCSDARQVMKRSLSLSLGLSRKRREG